MNHSKLMKAQKYLHKLSLDYASPIADSEFKIDAESEDRRLVSQIFNMITEREKRVLTMVADGYDYTEIAEEIRVSPEIAENIMAKLRERMIAMFPEIAAARKGYSVCLTA
jgi:DNA-binding NarL/FixJ family response regulator